MFPFISFHPSTVASASKYQKANDIVPFVGSPYLCRVDQDGTEI